MIYLHGRCPLTGDNCEDGGKCHDCHDEADWLGELNDDADFCEECGGVVRADCECQKVVDDENDFPF